MRVVPVDSLPLTVFGSHDATQHLPTRGMKKRWTTAGAAAVMVIELAKDGVIGEHAAPSEQLLLVTSGRVRVRCADTVVDCSAHDAVLFEAGDVHQTTALTDSVIVVTETVD